MVRTMKVFVKVNEEFKNEQTLTLPPKHILTFNILTWHRLSICVVFPTELCVTMCVINVGEKKVPKMIMIILTSDLTLFI